MTTNANKSDRIAVRGAQWKRPISIASEKFDQVSKAIISVLPPDPIRFSDLVKLVEKSLPDFEGSIAWYTVTIARELEVQGKLIRQSKPVRYSQPR